MVDLCLVAGEICDDDGEKAAVVGGFGSLFAPELRVPFSETFAGEGAIASIQGVSEIDCKPLLPGVYIMNKQCYVPNAAMQRARNQRCLLRPVCYHVDNRW